ncbi:MAG: copper chaperone [Methylococcaceae bacterium]|jgi:copper chaperone CopZ|nr:copper chaperone [Methylococcaceae bacterium]
MTVSVSLNVSGMKCGGCEASLSNALTALTGVTQVKASHLQKRVDVEFDDQQISVDDIEDAIVDAGFKLED